MKLITFGDSWTYGSELENPNTDCWTTQLANSIGCASINLGVPASSIPHMVIQFLNNLSIINKDDVCIFGLTSPTRYIGYDNLLDKFVNITTEAVYYTDIKPTGHPPDVVPHMLTFGCDFYKFQDSVSYQQLQSAMAIATLQKVCNQKNIKNYYFSYFEDLDLGPFCNLVDSGAIYNNGISIKSMLSSAAFNNISIHPTKNGHLEIANILKHVIQ